MLLRKYTDCESRLGLGQLFGVLGLIGLIAGGALGNPSVFSLFVESSRTLDFLRGFTVGISGAMLGLSLVFNTAALVSIRNSRSNRR